MMESLAYAGELLQDPQNMVLIFPQARLYSNFVDDIHFERGLLRVIKKAVGKFQYVFAATFIEYFQHKKPTVNVHVKSSVQQTESIEELKDLFQAHYTSAKLLQTQIII